MPLPVEVKYFRHWADVILVDQTGIMIYANLPSATMLYVNTTNPNESYKAAYQGRYELEEALVDRLTEVGFDLMEGSFMYFSQCPNCGEWITDTITHFQLGNNKWACKPKEGN